MIKSIWKILNKNYTVTCVVFAVVFYGMIILQHSFFDFAHVRRYIELAFVSDFLNKILSSIYNVVLSTLYLLPNIIFSVTISFGIIYFYNKVLVKK